MWKGLPDERSQAAGVGKYIREMSICIDIEST